MKSILPSSIFRFVDPFDNKTFRNGNRTGIAVLFEELALLLGLAAEELELFGVKAPFAPTEIEGRKLNQVLLLGVGEVVAVTEVASSPLALVVDDNSKFAVGVKFCDLPPSEEDLR